jgi:hypothetical protein
MLMKKVQSLLYNCTTLVSCLAMLEYFYNLEGNSGIVSHYAHLVILDRTCTTLVDVGKVVLWVERYGRV